MQAQALHNTPDTSATKELRDRAMTIRWLVGHGYAFRVDPALFPWPFRPPSCPARFLLEGDYAASLCLNAVKHAVDITSPPDAP